MTPLTPPLPHPRPAQTHRPINITTPRMMLVMHRISIQRNQPIIHQIIPMPRLQTPITWVQIAPSVKETGAGELEGGENLGQAPAGAEEVEEGTAGFGEGEGGERVEEGRYHEVDFRGEGEEGQAWHAGGEAWLRVCGSSDW